MWLYCLDLHDSGSRKMLVEEGNRNIGVSCLPKCNDTNLCYTRKKILNVERNMEHRLLKIRGRGHVVHLLSSEFNQKSQDLSGRFGRA